VGSGSEVLISLNPETFLVQSTQHDSRGAEELPSWPLLFCTLAGFLCGLCGEIAVFYTEEWI